MHWIVASAGEICLAHGLCTYMCSTHLMRGTYVCSIYSDEGQTLLDALSRLSEQYQQLQMHESMRQYCNNLHQLQHYVIVRMDSVTAA